MRSVSYGIPRGVCDRVTMAQLVTRAQAVEGGVTPSHAKLHTEDLAFFESDMRIFRKTGASYTILGVPVGLGGAVERGTVTFTFEEIEA